MAVSLACCYLLTHVCTPPSASSARCPPSVSQINTINTDTTNINKHNKHKLTLWLKVYFWTTRLHGACATSSSSVVRVGPAPCCHVQTTWSWLCRGTGSVLCPVPLSTKINVFCLTIAVQMLSFCQLHLSIPAKFNVKKLSVTVEMWPWTFTGHVLLGRACLLDSPFSFFLLSTIQFQWLEYVKCVSRPYTRHFTHLNIHCL